MYKTVDKRGRSLNSIKTIGEDDPVIVKLKLHIDSLDEGLTKLEIAVESLEKQVKLLNEVSGIIVPVG